MPKLKEKERLARREQLKTLYLLGWTPRQIAKEMGYADFHGPFELAKRIGLPRRPVGALPFESHTKHCERCGAPFERRREPAGAWVKWSKWQRQRFCSQPCRVAWLVAGIDAKNEDRAILRTCTEREDDTFGLSPVTRRRRIEPI